MTMALPRPSAIGTRPAYLDSLFAQSPMTPPSLHSSNSSLSCSSSNFDLRSAYHASRPLSPFDEESQDRSSVRSKRSFLSGRRFNFRAYIERRRVPPASVEEMISEPLPPPPPPPSQPTSPVAQASRPLFGNARRPSLPKLQTTNLPLPRGASSYVKKPLPTPPRSQAQELACHRCYYYAARHCNGWVMGGSNGDACEICLAAGFFGAK